MTSHFFTMAAFQQFIKKAVRSVYHHQHINLPMFT
jgi:hypothetical protein